MIVEILTFGNELLDGRRIDTNTTWIGNFLTSLGLNVRFHQTTQDRKSDIVDAFKIALDRSDVIISTGGLGPTQDDITFESLSEAIGKPLQFHPDIWFQIQAKFEKRGLPCPESNKRQAYLPKGAQPIEPAGTAPGCFMKVGEKFIFCLPGVPHEMQMMMQTFVLSKLQDKIKAHSFFQQGYSISGIAEALVEEKLLGSKMEIHPDAQIEIAYTASLYCVDVTFTVTPHDSKKTAQIKKDIDQAVQKIFQGSLIRWNDQKIEEHLIRLFEKKKWKLGLAESITGGLITSSLVNVPGCSNVLDQGLVTYSYPAKISVLGVLESTLATYGAVSVQCVLEMARGLKKKSGVDVALSICGIAGPGGATDEKPLGLTYICWIGPKIETTKSESVEKGKKKNYVKTTDFVGLNPQNLGMNIDMSPNLKEQHVFQREQDTAFVQGFVFSGDRKRNRMLATNQALMGLYSFLKNYE